MVAVVKVDGKLIKIGKYKFVNILEVAIEHLRVLAIFCSMVFTSDHPCIESI